MTRRTTTRRPTTRHGDTITIRHPGSSRSASTKSSSRSMPVSAAMSACDHSGSSVARQPTERRRDADARRSRGPCRAGSSGTRARRTSTPRASESTSARSARRPASATAARPCRRRRTRSAARARGDPARSDRRRRVAEAGRRAGDHVRLGRVQIAAGWVDAQRPARRAELLPRGEAERVAQQVADAGSESVARCGRRRRARAE